MTREHYQDHYEVEEELGLSLRCGHWLALDTALPRTLRSLQSGTM